MDPIYEMLQNHKVGLFLQSHGYKYIHIGSSWELDRVNRYADINLSYKQPNEFQMLLLQTSMLRVLPIQIFNPRLMQYNATLYQFERLNEIAAMRKSSESPIFVFAHLNIPHTPHVFDRDGGFIVEDNEDRKEGYLAQLIFCNEKIEEVIDNILTNSEISPVIILQGDHGPAYWPSEFFKLNEEEQTKIIMRILNAYHIPQDAQSILYDTITPVNTFRVIFNFYFDTNYELIKDRSFFTPDWTIKPYEFLDVTDILKE